MPNPSNVNPRNFRVERVLYNLNGFSIAWGEWEDGCMHLGMRWNGEGDKDQGYPKSFGNPMWFLVSPELSLTIAELIGRAGIYLPISPISTSDAN